MGNRRRERARHLRKIHGALTMADNMRGRVLAPVLPDAAVQCGAFEFKEFGLDADGLRIDALQPICDDVELVKFRDVQCTGASVFILGTVEGGSRHGEPCWLTVDDFAFYFVEYGDGYSPLPDLFH